MSQRGSSNRTFDWFTALFVRFALLGSKALLGIAALLSGAALLSAVLLGCSSEKPNSPVESCTPTQLLCGETCVDPLLSDAHCGACGVACASGQVCDGGACRDIGAAGCPAGRTLCDAACVDLLSSAAHCGSCGTSCGAGQCSAGICACAPGTSPCAGGCVDPQTDIANCGQCGAACAATQQCLAGVCGCAATELACSTGCSNVQTDVANCGACGTVCFPGQACSAGSCVCNAGLSLCTDACVDLQADANHCGVCGTACTGGRSCIAGSCQCAATELACNDVCVDPQTSAEHCGACGTACIGGQVCTAGSCQCPAMQMLCGDSCVDTSASTEHCGACDAACVTGQVCNSGSCECPTGQEVCDEACVDTSSSLEHCGQCGTACAMGQVCNAGACECPAGQDLCDDTCIDTQTDNLNCGGCGVTCGLGEGCNAGVCSGGAPGEDGCANPAEGLQLQKVALYQTVEIAVMEGGMEVAERNVGVVALRDTLVRVFFEVDADWTERELGARLHLDNGGERTVLFAEPKPISASSAPDDRDSTFEFLVSADLLTDQLRYAVEVVECGAAPGATVSSPRYPATDGIELGALAAGGLRVHIIPLLANGLLPDTSEEVLDIYRQGFLAAYPISDIEFTIGETVEVNDPEDWGGMLEGLAGLREDENPGAEVYYYGMLRPTEDIRDYCGNGCTAGVGYVPLGAFGLDESGRVALGLAYDDESSVQTMLHEVGHNHGRLHAPCVPQGGSIADVDPDYPYEGAELGVFGYDLRRDELIDPSHPDIMAYCDDPWFSDYTYAGLLDTLIAVNLEQQSRIIPTALLGSFKVLLLEPLKPPRWVRTIKGPALPAGMPETATVLDQNGAVVTHVTVYRTEISEINAFSIQVPVPEAGWHSLLLSTSENVQF